KVVLPALARQFKFDLNTPWGDLPSGVQRAILNGDAAHNWEGVLANIERRYNDSSSDAIRVELEEYMIAVPCDLCGGRRLKREALAVTIADRNIGEITELAVTDALAFFKSVPVRENGKPGLDREIAAPI